jgi:hypothetical protein
MNLNKTLSTLDFDKLHNDLLVACSDFSCENGITASYMGHHKAFLMLYDMLFESALNDRNDVTELERTIAVCKFISILVDLRIIAENGSFMIVLPKNK